MKYYPFEGKIYGVNLKLTIVDKRDTTFSIYWDGFNIGEIYYLYDEELQDAVWKTDNSFLKNCLGQLSEFIEISKFEEED